jgi:hypothetical protein
MRDRASFTGRPEAVIYKTGAGSDAFDAEQKRQRRQQWFKAFNRECVARSDTRVITTPASNPCIIECLPTNGWPDELRERGYPLEEIDGGSRILAHAVVEHFTKNADRSLSLVTGPTSQPTLPVTHAGICKTRRYSFRAP